MSGADPAEPVRIAMWSGPRNLSTALMRSFGNRPDTAVVDEPFYAAYLQITGLDHPMRAEVLASQDTDWRSVAATLAGPVPGGKSVFYQKHMTHHMVPEIGRDWMRACRHAFLIRRPERVLASYSAKRETVALRDIGFVEQAELYEQATDYLGAPPPVIDADRLLAVPQRVLEQLCAALGIAFTPAMLRWPAGLRPTDGVWAPHWYDAVRKSTGFAQPQPTSPTLNAHHADIAEQARPYYEKLARYVIG